MLLRNRRKASRPAAAVVEAAVVMSIFLLFLFGIIEYCQLVFVEQLLTTASREGARFAVVNTSDQNLNADTTAQVLQTMGGMDAQLGNFTIQVYQADANGVKNGAASDAPFGQYIVVQIDGDYTPFLPSFLYLNRTLHLSTKSLMFSEAN